VSEYYQSTQVNVLQVFQILSHRKSLLKTSQEQTELRLDCWLFSDYIVFLAIYTIIWVPGYHETESLTLIHALGKTAHYPDLESLTQPKVNENRNLRVSCAPNQ
jgi:hypothetical protein